MVVNDLDIDSFTVNPFKTNAVLIIYANAVLTSPITLEAFQPKTGKGKVTQRCSNRYLDDTPFRSFGDSTELPHMGSTG